MGNIGIKPFAMRLALGGFGSLPGALIGGIILGVTENLVAGYLHADWQNAATFVLIIVALALRPTGLFGKPDKPRV